MNEPAHNETNFPEDTLEIIEPIGKRMVIRKDRDKKETKGGIRLPDNIEIPTITGRIVAVSAEIESDPLVPLFGSSQKFVHGFRLGQLEHQFTPCSVPWQHFLPGP